MGAQEDHQAAVAYAVSIIEETRTLLYLAQEKAATAVSAVYAAVGPNTTVASAREALEYAGAAHDEIPEIIVKLTVSKGHLQTYAGGF